MKAFFAFLTVVLCAAPSLAGEAGRDLYVAGKYDQAMRLGAETNDATDLVFAARAALAAATTRACIACLDQAMAFTRRAIAADPKRPEAHIFLAVALGEQARRKGIVLARLRGDPTRAKAELDTALALDPHNALGLAAMGGWNIEIVRVGGPHLAKWLYGASLQTGLKDFAQALQREPDNVALNYQYALSLSGYDTAQYRGEITKALETAVKAAPQTAYEKVAQERSAELLDLLKHGDKPAYAARFIKFHGYH